MPVEFHLLAVLFIAWLMGSAGLQKLRQRQYTAEAIANYFPVLQGRLQWLAVLIGSAEIALAVLVLLPATSQFASLLVAALLALYLVAMAMQLIQGKTAMDCGCAGPDQSQHISSLLLLRNAILIAVAGLASVPVMQTNVGTVQIAVTCLILGFFILLYLCFEQLMSNRPLLAILRNN